MTKKLTKAQKARQIQAQIRREERQIQAQIRREEQKRVAEMEFLLDSRAGKLLKKGKPFIVVACDEPYYLEVYRLIRAYEKAKGTWTERDENVFNQTIVEWREDPGAICIGGTSWQSDEEK